MCAFCVCVRVRAVRTVHSLTGMYAGYVCVCVCVVACLCEHVCSGQWERGNVVKDFCGIFNVCY